MMSEKSVKWPVFPLMHHISIVIKHWWTNYYSFCPTFAATTARTQTLFALCLTAALDFVLQFLLTLCNDKLLRKMTQVFFSN